jgi:hypothetical protein
MDDGGEIVTRFAGAHAMFRIVAAAFVASLFSLPAVPARAEVAVRPAGANHGGNVQVHSVAWRYRTYRNGSSTGRRPGTGFTPWYLLPPTDPRRYNGPHYYWNK